MLVVEAVVVGEVEHLVGVAQEGELVAEEVDDPSDDAIYSGFSLRVKGFLAELELKGEAEWYQCEFR